MSESSEDPPRITIFSIPKPFRGQDDRAQRNAIGSWLRNFPAADILLLGDAEGTSRAAADFGVRHQPLLPTNRQGTPRLDAAFASAAEIGGELLLYVNADVILPDCFADAVDRLDRLVRKPFLGIARRVEVDIDRLIDWNSSDELDWLEAKRTAARRESILCKDVFLFRHGWFRNLPPFVVGRGNWDNWMVYAAKRMRLKVIDLSPSATLIHQRHGHGHVAGGRPAAYVRGDEARENQRLAGGRHWIRGSTADWSLTPDGLRARRCRWMQIPFWADLQRVARLGWELTRPP